MSPDSVTALTGAEDGSARLTNVQTGRLLGTLSGVDSLSHPSVPCCCCLVASLRDSERLTCLDARLASTDMLPGTGHTDSVEAACMAHMLPFSATASVDGRLLIWDTASQSVRATCRHPEVCSAQGPLCLSYVL